MCVYIYIYKAHKSKVNVKCRVVSLFYPRLPHYI